MESFKKYQNSIIITEKGALVNGDFVRDGIIFRARNGLLNDVFEKEEEITHPAVEAFDGSHIEHWKDGVLHSKDSPAIVDNKENTEEWYVNGKRKVPGSK